MSPAYSGRDLDDLLSGTAHGPVPEALRPVAGILAALAAAPACGELSGEAAARAVFRSLAPVPVPPPEPWMADAEHGTVPARTISFPPGKRAQRPANRHRRQGGTRTPRRLAAAATAAATAVAAAAVLLGVPSSFGQLTNFGQHAASATGEGTARPSASHRVAGGATREPSATLKAASATPVDSPAASVTPRATHGPGVLCREYYSFFTRQEPSASLEREAILRRKLDALAGSHFNVFGFCLPYLGYEFWGKAPWTPSAAEPPPNPGGPGVTPAPRHNRDGRRSGSDSPVGANAEPARPGSAGGSATLPAAMRL